MPITDPLDIIWLDHGRIVTDRWNCDPRFHFVAILKDYDESRTIELEAAQMCGGWGVTVVIDGTMRGNSDFPEISDLRYALREAIRKHM